MKPENKKTLWTVILIAICSPVIIFISLAYSVLFVAFILILFGGSISLIFKTKPLPTLITLLVIIGAYLIYKKTDTSIGSGITALLFAFLFYQEERDLNHSKNQNKKSNPFSP